MNPLLIAAIVVGMMLLYPVTLGAMNWKGRR